MTRYESYKDSVTPWTGRVPQHWDEKRGKYIFKSPKELNSDRSITDVLSLTYRGVVDNDPENPEGLVPKDYGTYQKFNKGELVFKLIDLENIRTSRVGLVHKDGIMSSAYIRLSPLDKIQEKYFYYQYFNLYKQNVYNALGAGVRSTLNSTDLLEITIIQPPLGEQKAIVTYLDKKLEQIDTFIKNKQRFIELLEEQKTAVINKAVTQGLGSNIEKKDSGINWIGQTPVDWEIKRIKYITKILRGKFSHRPRNDPEFYDGSYPFIQTGDVARAGKFITSYGQTLNEKGLEVSKLFPKGTLVMTIAANVGDISILDFEACFPDSIVGFVPESGVDLFFLFYLFTAMRQELLKTSPINTQLNLNVDRIGSLFAPLPPLDTQKQISNFLDNELEVYLKAQQTAQKEIDLINEYRTTLISKVVTGKIDVRTAV